MDTKYFSFVMMIIGLLITVIILALSNSSQSKIIMHQTEVLNLYDKADELRENIDTLNIQIEENRMQLERIRKIIKKGE